MMSTEQQLIAEAYTKMIEEAMHCSYPKKGCKCNKCKSNQKKSVKEAIDQNKDGDKDFDDVKIARMVASGMSKEQAIAKLKGKDNDNEEKESSQKNESLNLSQPEPLSFKSLYNKIITSK